MNRFVKICAILTVAATAGLGLAMNKAMTTKEIMTKLNKPPKGLTQLLEKELKAPEPSWEEIQSQAQEYVKLTTDLYKCEPSKGSADSWAKLTKQYGEAAKALDAAAQNKDKTAATAARQRLVRMCSACHRAHRG